MHTISTAIRRRISAFGEDAGTQAGILKIFSETGKVMAPTDLASLTHPERELFAEGLKEYMEDIHHPVRRMHAPIHYGRWIYWLSLAYYISLSVWFAAVIEIASRSNMVINWPAAWGWIVFVSILNAGLTLYGIYLEAQAYHRALSSGQRMVAAIAIIVLIIAIVGNMVAPYSGSADTIIPFVNFTQ